MQLTKQNIINLIKFHYDKDEPRFINEAMNISRCFESNGDDDLAQYVLEILSPASRDVFVPQGIIEHSPKNYETENLKYVDVSNLEQLYLPSKNEANIIGVMNAIKHNVGVNKFIFEGLPGTGKTETIKNIAKLLQRPLYMVYSENLIDSKLGQSNKNLVQLFSEIRELPNVNEAIILFDEIDALALDRINNNDVREMGRVTSTFLKELDRLTQENKHVVIMATTNLFDNLDKALIRRFDAVINFDQYTKEELINIAINLLNQFLKTFKTADRDSRLFKKILQASPQLPLPADLKNIIRSSLAFSSIEDNSEYFKRLYNALIGDLESADLTELSKQGFTVREIEKLTGQSKSTVAIKIKKAYEKE